MNDKLNIQNLIDLLAEKHGMDKNDADSFVKEFFQLIEESLKKDKYVKIKGLGTFKLIDIESRESVNVNTGERFEIQGHTKVSFAPEPTLKEIINRPFSHFETVVLNDGTILEGTTMEGEDDDAADQEGVQNSLITEKESATIIKTLIEQKVEGTLPTPLIQQVSTASNESIARVKASAITTKATTEYITVEPLKKSFTDSSGMKYFIGVVILVIVLCASALVFMYYPNLLDSSKSSTEKITEVEEKKKMEQVMPIEKDTAQFLDEHVAAEEDVPLSPKEIIQEVPLPDTKEMPSLADPTAQTSLGYTIVGTETEHVVKPGETLRKISLLFYKTNTLWPYIVTHNSKIIKNPDNVPLGAVIKIPKLIKKQ